jgi:CubicO group peptidase (beta-lactamase class C family)
MASSNTSTPPEDEWYRCVIPGDAATNFAFDAGTIVASGGIFSTTRGLAKFGIGALNSTLLSPDQTRKWMKPVSHTARLQYSGPTMGDYGIHPSIGHYYRPLYQIG